MPVRHRRSNRRGAQSRVVNQPSTARPVTRLALPTSPPHRRTPTLLATRPSSVTRYRPPAPTNCTHPTPITHRNNRLKVFPLTPNGSPHAPQSQPPAHTAPPSGAVQEPTDQPEITASAQASSPTPPLRTVPRNTLRPSQRICLPRPTPPTLLSLNLLNFRYSLIFRYRNFRYSRNFRHSRLAPMNPPNQTQVLSTPLAPLQHF